MRMLVPMMLHEDHVVGRSMHAMMERRLVVARLQREMDATMSLRNTKQIFVRLFYFLFVRSKYFTASVFMIETNWIALYHDKKVASILAMIKE